MPLDEEYSQGDYSNQEEKNERIKKADEFHLISIPKLVTPHHQAKAANSAAGDERSRCEQEPESRSTSTQDLVLVTMECGAEYCRLHVCTGEVEESGGQLLKTRPLYTKFHASPKPAVAVAKTRAPKAKDKDAPSADSGEQSDSSSSSYPPFLRIPSPEMMNIPDKLGSKIKKYIEFTKGMLPLVSSAAKVNAKQECLEKVMSGGESVGSQHSLSTTASGPGYKKDERKGQTRPKSAPASELRHRKASRTSFSNIKPKVNTRWESGGPCRKFSLRESSNIFSCYSKKNTAVQSPGDESRTDNKRQCAKIRSFSVTAKPVTKPPLKSFRAARRIKIDKAIQTEDFLLRALLSSLRLAENDENTVSITRTSQKPSSSRSDPVPLSNSNRLSSSRHDRRGCRDKAEAREKSRSLQTTTEQKPLHSEPPPPQPVLAKNKVAKPETYKEKLLAQMNGRERKDTKQSIAPAKTVAKSSSGAQKTVEKGTFVYPDCTCSDLRCSCCGSHTNSPSTSPAQLRSSKEHAAETRESLWKKGYESGLKKPGKIYHY